MQILQHLLAMLLTLCVALCAAADCVPSMRSDVSINTTVNATDYKQGTLDLCTVEGIPLQDAGVDTGAQRVRGVTEFLSTIPDNTCKASTTGVLDK